MQNFQAQGLNPQTPCLRRLGALPQDPQLPPEAGGSASRPPHTAPIANFWLRTRQLSTVYNYMHFCSFCFEQFFLDRSVANFMMLSRP